MLDAASAKFRHCDAAWKFPFLCHRRHGGDTLNLPAPQPTSHFAALSSPNYGRRGGRSDSGASAPAQRFEGEVQFESGRPYQWVDTDDVANLVQPVVQARAV